MLHAYLVAASAFVLLILGLAHLWFTFVGNRLHPREAQCRTAMETSHPVPTRQTTLLRAWIGFNASHSFGAMLFGLVYGYLSLAQPATLFGSTFLLGVGALLLAGYVALGKLYWFSTPFAGILLSSMFYVAGVALAASGA